MCRIKIEHTDNGTAIKCHVIGCEITMANHSLDAEIEAPLAEARRRRVEPTGGTTVPFGVPSNCAGPPATATTPSGESVTIED